MESKEQSVKRNIIREKKYFRNGGHNGRPQHPRPVAISTQPHKPAKTKQSK